MRITIVCGGPPDLPFLSDYFEKNKIDVTIAADRGYNYLTEIGRRPDILLGDYDSVEQGAGGIAFSGGKMYTYPAEKDFSDSEAALNVAMDIMKARGELGRLDFLCATGGRLDHFLANIGLLNTALRAGIDARILDAKNEIRLIDRSISLRREEIGGRYVSIIPYTERVENVTLRGFHYPLEGAVVTREGTLTISNLCEAEEAEIRFGRGILILILSGD